MNYTQSKFPYKTIFMDDDTFNRNKRHRNAKVFEKQDYLGMLVRADTAKKMLGK